MLIIFFFKQKTAYEMRISDWSSDVCSSDLLRARVEGFVEQRLFEEGADVKAGDLLIVLEKAAVEAEIGQIRGQITAAEGTLQLAQIEVDRRTTLVQPEPVAQVQLGQAKAQYAQAPGELHRLTDALTPAPPDLHT